MPQTRFDPVTRLIVALQNENTFSDVPANGNPRQAGWAVEHSRTKRNDQIVRALISQPPSQIKDSFAYAKQLPIPSLKHDVQTGRLTEKRWNGLLQQADKSAVIAKHHVNHYPYPDHNQPYTNRYGKTKYRWNQGSTQYAPIHAVNFMSKDYPQNLRDAAGKNGNKQFPPVIYVQGSLKALHQPSFALIGSRNTHASEPAGKLAAKYAQFFSQHGFADVGGLADGADSIGHRATIGAHGHTIAILPEALDQSIYPLHHSVLAKHILQSGGALVSARPIGQKMGRHDFGPFLVSRDQWQTAMSDGVLAVKSQPRHGTIHAMQWATVMHRPLAVPDAHRYRFPDPQQYAGLTPFVHSGQAKALYSGHDVISFGHDLVKSHLARNPKSDFMIAWHPKRQRTRQQTQTKSAPAQRPARQQTSRRPSSRANAFRQATTYQSRSSYPYINPGTRVGSITAAVDSASRPYRLQVENSVKADEQKYSTSASAQREKGGGGFEP